MSSAKGPQASPSWASPPGPSRRSPRPTCTATARAANTPPRRKGLSKHGILSLLGEVARQSRVGEGCATIGRRFASLSVTAPRRQLSTKESINLSRVDDPQPDHADDDPPPSERRQAALADEVEQHLHHHQAGQERH